MFVFRVNIIERCEWFTEKDMLCNHDIGDWCKMSVDVFQLVVVKSFRFAVNNAEAVRFCYQEKVDQCITRVTCGSLRTQIESCYITTRSE